MRRRSFAAALGATVLLHPLVARAADPTTADCLGANNSAIDFNNVHQLRAARAQLLICAAASCPSDVKAECLRRVDAINAQIPTIAFEARDGAGKDLTAVTVTMDGQPLADHLEGTALSVDPGSHTFTFDAPGHATVTKQFVLVEGQKNRREPVVFSDGGPAATSSAPATATAAPGPAAPRAAVAETKAESASGLGTQRTIALVAGGVGVVGLVLGTTFGFVTMSKKNDAQTVCPGDKCPTAGGTAKWNDATSAGNVSTAMFIVGGVGLAAAGALWFTAKSPDKPAVQVGLGLGSVRLAGAF